MQVKFLKKHLKHNAGDVAIVDDARAKYFERMKIATAVNASTAKPAKSKTKKTTPKKTAKKSAVKKSAKK